MTTESREDVSILNSGWAIFPNVLSNEFVHRMRSDCLKWIEVCEEYQIANKINAEGDGTAHHAVGAGDSIDAFIQMHLFHEQLSAYFDNRPYILHACNPVGGFPRKTTYVHRIHRDTATYIPGYNLRLNMIVMLDDFTLDNGATQIMPHSHLMALQPSEGAFNDACESITASAGSIVLFNSYLWHRGGYNTTNRSRVALTLSYGPAFIKPQMDYARLLGEQYGTGLSDLSRQVLGYNSRVPVTLDEWYKPKGERLYMANQG